MRRSAALASALLLSIAPTFVLGQDDENDTAAATSSMQPVPPQQWAVLFPWVVQVLGVVVYFLLTHYELPIPYVAAMFVLGACMGVGAYHNSDSDDQLTVSILQWSEIDSSVLLLVFLPGLIFRDAIEINFHYFAAAASQILLLAFPVVVLGAALTACFAVYVYGWSWNLGMTLGAILGSTDPIAVSTALRRAGAPPRLTMHLGGESMLNDGSAVVVYTIFAQKFFATLGIDGFGSDIGIGEGIAIFFKMSLGGFLVGVAFAMGLMVLLYELDRRLERENNVVEVAAAVSMAFLSYYVSEQVCAMSGVLSCVVMGITSSAFGKGLISDPELMDSYLKLVEHLLNTLLFTLGGTVWGRIVANPERFSLTDWGYLLLLYVSVMVIRTIQIVLVYPIMKRIGIQTTWQESVFLIFGGLRGAVGIALAVSLNRSVFEVSDNEEHRLWTSKLLGLSGGVTALTLLINGSLAGPVLRGLGLSKNEGSRRAALRAFESSARGHLVSLLKQKRLEPRFSDARLSFIQHQVLFLRDIQESELVENDVESTVDNASSRCLRRASTTSVGRRLSVTEVLLQEDMERQHMETLLRASNHQDMTPEERVTEVRIIFLELLNAAYTELLERGELDAREDNGYNLSVLKQSVELAWQSLEQQESTGMNDFAYTQQFSVPATQPRWLISGWEGFWLTIARLRGTQKNPHSSSEFQQLRIQVLLAMEFVEAHALAERQFHLYLERRTDNLVVAMDDGSETATEKEEDPIDAAVQTVLNESKEQVYLAQAFLRKVPQRWIEDIHSRYLSSILLHKLSQFVEQSYAAGLLKEKEATQYLRRIDRRVGQLHSCHYQQDGGGGGLSSRIPSDGFPRLSYQSSTSSSSDNKP